MMSAMLFLVSLLTLMSAASANRYFDADGLKFNYTVGDLDSTQVSQIVPPNGGSSFIAANYSFTHTGVVNTIKYRTYDGLALPSNVRIHLQAWRPEDGNKYQLISSIQHIPTISGINEVAVKMAVRAGDILGFSCKPICPIAKDDSQPQYKVLVRMSLPSDRLNVGDKLSFGATPVRSKISLVATIEANGVIPIPISDPETSSTSRGVASTSSTPAVVPTLPVESPRTDPSGRTLPFITDSGTFNWVWTVIIVASVLVFILLITIMIGCLCYKNKQMGYQYKHRQLQASIMGSRPTSFITTDLPSTLGRTPGATTLHQINEIEHTNQSRPSNDVSDLYAVVQRPPRPISTAHNDDEPIVTFDNGTTNRPNPPASLPPVTEL